MQTSDGWSNHEERYAVPEDQSLFKNYRNNIKDRYLKLSSIEEDLDQLFKNSNKVDKYEYFHKGDKSGKSKITAIQYKLNIFELIEIHKKWPIWISTNTFYFS